MDYAINEALANPTSTLYVLIYEGKEIRYKNGIKNLVPPNVGSADAKIRSMKKYLLLRKVSTNTFSFVKAGFREESTVEFWLAALGEPPPKPTPTTKMKYRKGNPSGFCTWCCD